MTPLDLVTSKVQTKKVGANLMACCPAHDDSNPSLSIDEADDGRVLLHCHRGCATDAVVSSMGLAMSDLFPPKERTERRRIVDTYPYHDADGEVIYEVVRYDPKDFRQRRPNGRGGWVWKLDGIDRVLYRLPAVHAAAKAGDTIYVTEGEKDADALVRAGVCATTAAQGAGKWHTVASVARDALRGAHVVIVGDRDKAGQDHVRDVAASLVDVAASITVAEPAGDHHDAADHLGAGCGVDEFKLVASTAIRKGDTPTVLDWLDQEPPVETEVSAEVDEVPTVEHADFVRDGATFILDEASDLEARWGQRSDVLWARGESLMIVGPPGVGKTTIAGQVVHGLLGLGHDVLGLPITPATRVLYLAMDRPRQVRRALRRLFTEQHRQALADRLVVRPGPIPADLGKNPEVLLEMARTYGCDAIVVDSLKDAAVKLTDDESAGNVNRAIQHCNAADVDVLVLHHQRKGQGGDKPTKLEDVYGSTWITAGTGSVILLWGEAGSELVELSHLKQPADVVGPWKVEHDHHAGTSKVVHGFDALAYIRARPQGVTVSETAQSEHGTVVSSGSAKWKKTERRLRGLVRDGFARVDGQPSPGIAARYYPVDASVDMTIHVDKPVDTPISEGGST